MSGGKLEVQIGADKSDFDKKIKEVEFDIKELSKVKLDRLKLGLDTREINSQIKDAKNNLKSLQTTIKDTGSSFSGMTPKVASGGNALMQFSRIAQDAPYGIIGIGNNITATVESFGYLKQATGSTGGALKALGQSIMGSGGVLLGVSLLTTGLTYMAQSGLTLGDVINKLVGETNAYSDALQKATTGAFSSENVVKAVEDVNQLTNEVQLAKEGFLSKDKVVEHYNETMGKTTGIVKTLDQVEQQLVKNGDAYIKMMLYKATATLAQAEAAKELLNREKSSKDETQKHIGVLEYFLLASGQVYNVVTALGNAEKNRKEAINDSTKAMNANLAVAKKFNEAAAAIAKKNGFNFFGDTSIPKVKDVKPIDIKFKFKPDPTIKKEINTFLSDIGFKYTSPLLQMNLIPDDVGVRARARLKEVEDALIAFDASANDLITNTISGTFASLGDAIGNAIATGGDVLSAIGQSIIQAFAGFLSSMGDLLIKYGTLAVLKGKLDLAIAAGGPVSIAAGIAAIAVGVALKAAGAAIGSYSSSGGRSGGTSTASGAGASNSSFTSSGFGSGGGGGTVVFEIAGTKLIGVLNNTLSANKRLGGAIGLG